MGKMSTLYEITGDYLRLLEMLEEEENIDPQAFADTLDGIDGEFEIKADNYARIIKELWAESEKYAAEVGRMQARMETLANNEKRLKQYLSESMNAMGKTKFKTDLFSFNIQRNGGTQPMEVDELGVTKAYMKMVPDNAKIRKALEEGKKLKFAELKERGEHLSIR